MAEREMVWRHLVLLLSCMASSGVMAEEPLWPSEIRRIDPSTQAYERLPDRVPELNAVPTEPGFAVQGFVRILDGSRFVLKGRRYRLAGLESPSPTQVCLEPDGARRACGLEARAALAHLLDPRARCREIDASQPEVVVTCKRGNKDIGMTLLERGIVQPAGQAH